MWWTLPVTSEMQTRNNFGLVPLEPYYILNKTFELIVGVLHMTKHMTKSLTFSKKTPVLSSIHTKSVFLNPNKYRGILGATAINNCITVLGPGVEEVHGFFLIHVFD